MRETPYAEVKGDRPQGIGLDVTDLATLQKLTDSGVPTVVVLVSGPPARHRRAAAGDGQSALFPFGLRYPHRPW